MSEAEEQKPLDFHFLFHDGSEIVFHADKCQHFTGHAALTNATVLLNTKNSVPVGSHFARFNIALNGDLFGMYPAEPNDKCNCVGFDHLTTCKDWRLPL